VEFLVRRNRKSKDGASYLDGAWLPTEGGFDYDYEELIDLKTPPRRCNRDRRSP
jgi:hypothetical protein